MTVQIYATTIFRIDDNRYLLSDKISLVPLLDMCTLQSAEEPLFNLKYVEGDVDDYVCTSLQKVRSGLPISRNYTQRSSYALFMDYGFVPHIKPPVRGRWHIV